MFTSVLKTVNNKVLSKEEVEAIAREIERRAEEKGFRTHCYLKTPRKAPSKFAADDPRKIIRDIRAKAKGNVKPETYTIDIGDTNDFYIDTSIHGMNAQVSRNERRGYTQTSLPTWSQREEFYSMINDIFDDHKISAHVTSSYRWKVRSRTDGRISDLSPCHWMTNVKPESVIRMEVKADDREKEYRAKVNKQAKEQRAWWKKVKACTNIVVQEYDYRSSKNVTKNLSPEEFKTVLSGKGRGYYRDQFLSKTKFFIGEVAYDSEFKKLTSSHEKF